jgi:hypothetical protein
VHGFQRFYRKTEPIQYLFIKPCEYALPEATAVCRIGTQTQFFRSVHAAGKPPIFHFFSTPLTRRNGKYKKTKIQGLRVQALRYSSASLLNLP